MDITINRKRSVEKNGDLICTKDNKLYAIICDPGERYPYHLLCFETFTIIESYDSLPTNKELEEDIDDELDGIYEHNDLHVTLN